MNFKKKLFSFIYFSLSVLSCKVSEEPVTPPFVTTNTTTDISENSAKVFGEVMSDGNSIINQRGFFYSENPISDLNQTKILAVADDPFKFSAVLSNLKIYQKYYYKAFATNSIGTRVGSEKTFQTSQSLVKLNTNDVGEITNNSVFAGLTINSNGGSPISEYGIVISSSNSNPTILDRKIVLGSIVTTFPFYTTKIIGELLSNTKYYLRSYAINSIGVSYGDTKTITTINPIINQLKNGLMAYYPFNGNTNDVSGNGNHGTNNGVILNSDRFLNPSAAYYFNGNSNITIPNSSSLNPNDITISLWYKSELKNSTIIAKSNPLDASAYSYALKHQDEFFGQKGMYFGYGLGNCSAIGDAQDNWTSENLLAENKWYHVVFSVNRNGDIKLYINNDIIKNMKGASFVSCNSINSSLRIGGVWWNNDPEKFKGIIDDVGIWNRVLSAEEIKFLFNYNFQP